MQIEKNTVRLVPMTEEMYLAFFRDYENDPDLLLPGQSYVPYQYSQERVERYIRRQRERNRISLAVLCGDDIAGEIILKDIEPRRCATMSITLKNAKFKDHGIGTRAETLAVQYVFDTLDIPTVYADTVRSNERSQHVLEKVGFSFIREDKEFRYYRIDKR